MKSVLISIRPEWCSKIARGEKTIEVRKTAPKLEAPFKCYIYCTKSKKSGRIDELDQVLGGGMVIGEFVCNEIFPISVSYSDPNHRLALREFPFTCLTDKEIMDYLGNGKEGYGWHISNSKIYDKPKPLRSFHKPCPYKLPDGSRMDVPCPCDKYTHEFDEESGLICCTRRMKIPPQSWCYVEELKDEK